MSAGRTGRQGLPGGVASVADKRFRRSEVRPGRRRSAILRAWRVGRALLVLVVVGAAVAYGSSRVVDARLLSIDRVIVQGNQRLSLGEIDALIGSVRGESLLMVDLNQVEARLRDSPWVASVTVRRLLPSTVDVRIVERDPVAIARLGQQLYLVDASGIIVDGYGPQYVDFDLPIVDGLAATATTGGPAIDSGRAQLVARFLTDLGGRPALRRSVSQMDVSRDDNVIVLLEDDPTLLYLGDEQFVERLRMYLDLRPTLGDQLSDVDYVDLRYGQRVIVKERNARKRR